ncbi:hypothetical protein [Comamonas humi]
MHSADIEEEMGILFYNVDINERALRSMVIHLGLPYDISRAKMRGLKAAVASQVRQMRANDHPAENLIINQLEVIARKAQVPENAFEPLCKYGTKLLARKLLEISLFNNNYIRKAFALPYPVRHLLCYACDVTEGFITGLEKKFNQLHLDLIRSDNWNEKARWFDGDDWRGKIKAANDCFFKNGYRSNIWSPLEYLIKSSGGYIKSWEDIEVFLYYDFRNDKEKNSILENIKSLYQNRLSREKSRKEQRNFSIYPQTYQYMLKIAKKNDLSRSGLLDVIFKQENEEFLQELLKLRL